MADVKIKKRADVNPDEGIREYGRVEFADPVNNKYPIDTPEHIMSAWRYIHQGRNEAEYSGDEVKIIENRIINAAKEHSLEVYKDEHGEAHISED